MKSTTFLIKTFNRYFELNRLIESILYFYPNNQIIVVDDSYEPKSLKIKNVKQFVLPPDTGISYGRNYALTKIETNYFVLLDDDFVFTQNTNIQLLRNIILEYDIDIVAGSLACYGKHPYDYHGSLEIINNILYLLMNNPSSFYKGLPLYDIVMNFFIAKTSSILKIKWDEELKIVEHEDFFLRAKNKLKISHSPNVFADHFPAGFSEEKRRIYTKILWNKYDLINEIIIDKDGVKRPSTHWEKYEEHFNVPGDIYNA